MTSAARYDFHVHPDWSFDGRGRPEEYLEAAVRRGIAGVVFTPHVYHLPERRERFGIVREGGEPVSLDDPHWFDRYRKDLQRAARGHAVAVRAGIEIDYDPRERAWLEQFIERARPDFIVGSIHLLHGLNLMIPEDFQQLLDQYEPHRLLTDYLHRVQEMVEWGRIDTVAHLCCYLRHVPELLPVPPVLPRLPLQSLFAAMNRKNVALEISTALYRQGGNSVNPPPALLPLAKEAGVPHFTLASDAHDPEDLASHLDEAWRAGEQAGLSLLPFPAERCSVIP